MAPHKAIIIGGGPAGSSAALGLLHCGYQVTILEQRTHWMDRICGSSLSPEAVRHIQWLGVHPDVTKAGAVPVRTMLLPSPRKSSPAMRTIQIDHVSLAIERKLLEDLLLDTVKMRGGKVVAAARALNLYRDVEKKSWIVTYRKTDPVQAEFDFGTKGAGQPPLVKLNNVEAPLVVIAAGRYSLGSFVHNKPVDGWYGFHAVYKNLPQRNGDQSLHFFQNGYVGVLSLSGGYSNVCGLIQKKGQDLRPWDDVFREILKTKPSLKILLDQGERVGEFRAEGPLPFGTQMKESDGPFLAGDSAAVGDPFLGEGIGRALAAGPMIAEAIQQTSPKNSSPETILENYQRLWKASYSRRLITGQRIRNLLAKKVFRTSVLGILMSQAWIREKLQNIARGGFFPSSENKGFIRQQTVEASAEVLRTGSAV